MTEPLFNNLILLWMGIGVFTFFYLLKVTAPYGRHTTNQWGPLIGNRLGWVIMEVPVMIMILLFVFPVVHTISTAAWLMLGLFFLHYLNRTFIFPLRLRTQGKKMPLVIVLSAILFNLVNGSSLGYYFAHYETYDVSFFRDPAALAGILLFFTGMAINWKSDTLLIGLRKPGETHYVMPTGWLFRYISCPNLFGELVEWLGFAILCRNLPAWSFFIWSAANLIPRAISHHKWYKAKFPDYPAERKAVIPSLI